MNLVTKLSPIFISQLGWNKARDDLLALFIIALLEVRTVCLTQIAVEMPDKAKIESKYKRLQRFFAGFDMCMDA